MNRYRVDWHPEFENIFQSFRDKLAPEGRRELTAIVIAFEQSIGSDPRSGIPLRDGGWIFQIKNFRFFYELDEADLRVILRSMVQVRSPGDA